MMQGITKRLPGGTGVGVESGGSRELSPRDENVLNLDRGCGSHRCLRLVKSLNCNIAFQLCVNYASIFSSPEDKLWPDFIIAMLW